MAEAADIVDATEATFNDEVAEYSMQKPVVVDFWAEWCGPCKTLGPILEELAERYQGAFRLAKVDVDQNATLASYFGIQSIPAVFALYQMRPVDAFSGGQSKTEVQRFIDRVLEQCGVEVPQPEPEPPSDPDEARTFWRQRLEQDDKDGRALLELGRLQLAAGEDEEASRLLERVEPSMDEYNEARATLALQDLWKEVQEAGGEDVVRERAAQEPDMARLAAYADAVRGRFGDSLRTLTELLASGPPEVRSPARSATRTILEAAGRGDPEVEAKRRELAALLF